MVKLGDKICNFVSLYRSPNQSEDEFENFSNNFELTLIVAIGDFNAKSSNWYTGDTNIFEGSKIEAITSQFGLQQIINEPTHIQGKSESCIDLIFSSQPNLVMSSGIHSSLHQNCHHQIKFAKFNLKVHYPRPYEREVWHFKKVNTDHIKRAINRDPWERSFANLDINEKVYLFNKTIRNILSNFIPHDTITFDDRDLSWINSQVKHLINEKNTIYKNYFKNKKSNQSFITFQSFQSQLSSLITNLKNKYYSKVAKKSLDPSTSPKTYWSILKTFLNSKNILVIPPIFHDNKFITDFKQKVEIFNSHFSKQYTPLINNSKIPSECPRKSNESLSSITFEINDIMTKIIKNLDPNKSHGHDMLSICMLKLCGESIYKPFNLTFKSCLKTGQFPSEWKKANVVPVFKKVDKQLVKNYGPISLLPITGKIFERLLYNQMFEFVIRNDLISQKQSGFKPGDFFINQLLAITHEIYKSFDACLDVRAVFLDISKAFDKVWHQGLLYKLKQNAISGNLLETLTDFLKDRKQRVA